MKQLVFGFAQDDSPETECFFSTLEPSARGAIFTRPEVVDFILDLVGYTKDSPLFKKRLLEPSFGNGAFLLPIIRRLLSSWRLVRTPTASPEELGDSVRAVELHGETFHDTRREIVQLLIREGITPSVAEWLADRWLLQGDFLLTPSLGLFDFVVGNPPYVRQELIPAPLLAEYRKRYRTLYDRADLYVPFIERSLSLLRRGGVLGFICSDRWMKNRYGAPLRGLVTNEYSLKIYVDMTDTQAFHSDVSAYPAITVIARESSGTTRIARRPNIDRKALTSLAMELCSPMLDEGSLLVNETENIARGEAPWVMDSPRRMELLQRLEKSFPTLEEAGCIIGIGVATGADRAFIAEYNTLDVEPSRKLPLVTTKDIISGEVSWQGLGVVNPYTDDGTLVDLNSYPRLKQYFEERRNTIALRHCARKNVDKWYRTIDRIVPSLAEIPKLLIPDIKGTSHVVYEDGKLYPHHNLYYVLSGEWELRSLQAVLLSAIARLFVESYTTRMRGGYLRFQAQYLRRIRIPQWREVPRQLKEELAEAASKRDIYACDAISARLYGLTREEWNILKEDRSDAIKTCGL